LNIQSDVVGTVDQSTHTTQQRVREAMALANNMNSSTHSESKQPPQILPGHMILVQTRSSVKLGPRWLGPYKVISSDTTNLKYENHRGHTQETNRSHAKHALIDSTIGDEFLSHQERYMSDKAKRRQQRADLRQQNQSTKTTNNKAKPASPSHNGGVDSSTV
jgi:hypothetical protein